MPGSQHARAPRRTRLSVDMFAVHSFATHSSAAAFRPVIRRCVPIPAVAACGRRARAPSAADRDVALAERRAANRARVERPPAEFTVSDRTGTARATARRACRPTNASPRPTDPHPTPSGTRR